MPIKPEDTGNVADNSVAPCLKCGYDLSGAESSVCPECGRSHRCVQCGYELHRGQLRICPECGRRHPFSPSPPWPTARIIPLFFSGSIAIVALVLVDEIWFWKHHGILASTNQSLQPHYIMAAMLALLVSATILRSAYGAEQFGRPERLAAALALYLLMALQWFAFFGFIVNILHTDF